MVHTDPSHATLVPTTEPSCCMDIIWDVVGPRVSKQRLDDAGPSGHLWPVAVRLLRHMVMPALGPCYF